MNRPRLVNFNLWTITYPFTAIISLLHRLSGLVIFFFIPFLLWALKISLQSEAGFEQLQHLLNLPFLKCISWLFLVSLFYHLAAGVRHMLMDIGIGEELARGRYSAILVVIFTVAFAVGLGIWLY